MSAWRLKEVKELKRLQSPDLTFTGVTDGGLEHLAGLDHLHNLSLVFTKVSAAGVKRLQQALPECQIDFK